MKILIDSSVWIDYFRGGKDSEPLDELLENNQACTCGLILAEIIPFLNQRKEKELVDLLKNVPRVECVIDWDRIISHQTRCLKKGINGIGIPDLIIAETAALYDVKLFTLDKHFRLMNRIVSFDLFL